MILVRQASIDDASEIGRVHVESWRTSYRDILPDDYLTSLSDVRVAASWADILNHADRSGATYVAESQRHGLIGFADCGPLRGGKQTRGEISSIYLLSAWQRKGLGRRLLASAARHLAALGYQSLAIWALEANHARGFYEALGGELADQRQIRFAGAVLDEVCYRWPEIVSLLLADVVAEHARMR